MAMADHLWGPHAVAWPGMKKVPDTKSGIRPKRQPKTTPMLAPSALATVMCVSKRQAGCSVNEAIWWSAQSYHSMHTLAGASARFGTKPTHPFIDVV